MNPEYPAYIISKGRADTRLTSKAFEKMGLPYRIVIEPQEYGRYAAVIDPRKILVLPFSHLGQGSIPARNWVWDHSLGEGHRRHWIVDDNISGFYRFHRNLKVPVRDGTVFRVMEEFVDRYVNVRMAGPNYEGLVLRRSGSHRPFRPNTRVYSCILVDNTCRFRWRGRYNEDTDLSLRVLKAGDCTILFNAFLAEKEATMDLKGGNTDELYRQDDRFDGRLEMARSLRRQHPDVVTITRKWGRWQHQVDYRPFKANRLIRRPSVTIKPGVNDYGMRLVTTSPGDAPAPRGRRSSSGAAGPRP
jgi:hypothetical protein